MDSDNSHSTILWSSLAVGLLALLIAFMLQGSGTPVKADESPKSEPAESKTQLNTILYGPYKLTQAGRIHDITITYKPSLSKNGSRWCEFELLNMKKEPVAEFGHEFWSESGRDSEGSWSESDRRFTQKVVLKEPGSYYISAGGEKPIGSAFKVKEKTLKKQGKVIDYSFKAKDFDIRVKEGSYDVSLLWWVVGVCAIYPGLAILIWIINNSD